MSRTTDPCPGSLVRRVAATVPGIASAGSSDRRCPAGGWRIVLPIHQPQAMDHNGDSLLADSTCRTAGSPSTTTSSGKR